MEDLQQILTSGQSEKTLLTIFPHPDDESMPVGGLLIAAKKAGWKVVVVSLTAGGAGRIHIRGNGKSLKEIRREELRQAAKIMGVDEVVIGDFDDGRLRNENGWKKWIDTSLEKYKPQIVVTYDPSGFYGHPDHIVVSKYLLTKFQLNRVGLWQLWFMAVPELFKIKWKIEGMQKVEAQMVFATHRLDFGWGCIKKWMAVRAHKSQNLGKGLPLPLWMFMAIFHFEWYHKVDRRRNYPYKYINYEI
jgi:LmbE family N-acetylglucosaminyl deacetylase